MRSKCCSLFSRKLVGRDLYGNHYYCSSSRLAESSGEQNNSAVQHRNNRRWVVYKGIPEASKIPPEWHIWLHYIVDFPPSSQTKLHVWQKQHIPNLTGTKNRYLPPGHEDHSNRRDWGAGGYEAWDPEK